VGMSPKLHAPVRLASRQKRLQRYTPVTAASFCRRHFVRCAPEVALFRLRIAKTFREVCPEGRIVSITNQPLNQPPDADVVIYGVDGAEALIEAVRGDVTSEPPIKGAA
jgi:hypothetical protein